VRFHENRAMPCEAIVFDCHATLVDSTSINVTKSR